MKRLLVTLAAAGLLVGLVAGPVAAAGVQRNQLTTTVYSSTYGSGHVWTLTFSGCDNSVV
jgi:hypothetical protein